MEFAARDIGNGGRAQLLAVRRSVFPPDVVARIFRPSRSVMTSGSAGSRNWKLVFERRDPLFIEPLMGWTGDDDTITQVELTFPTREAAVAYAERQGLSFIVDNDERAKSEYQRATERAERQRAFGDMLSAYLELAWLHTLYGTGATPVSVDLEQALRDPAAVFAAPADVVAEANLSLESKRAILENWQQHVADLATAQSMPEGERRSMRDQVAAAISALERQAQHIVGIATRSEVPSAQSVAGHVS